MKKSLGWESFKAVGWSFSGMAFSLFNGVLAARILDPSDRGILALALTLSGLSHLFSSIGTNVAVRTFEPTQDWASFRTYFSLSFRLMFIDFILIFGLVGVFVLFGRLNPSPELIVIAVLSLATFVCNQLLDVLNASGRVSLSALINSLGHGVTMVGLLFVYLVGVPSNAAWAVGAYAVGFFFRSAAVGLAIRSLRLSIGRLSADRGRKLLRHGVKFWGVNIGQTMTFRADQLLLAALASTYQVGIYAVAVAPAALMHVVSNSIGQTLYRQAAVRTLTPRTYVKAQAWAVLITLAYVVFMWVFCPFFDSIGLRCGV